MRSKVFVLLVLGFVVCSSDVRGMPAPGLSLESVSSSGKTSVFSTVATAVEHAGTFAWIYLATRDVGLRIAKRCGFGPSKREEYMMGAVQKFLLSPGVTFVATIPSLMNFFDWMSSDIPAFYANILPATVLIMQSSHDIWKFTNWGLTKIGLSWHRKIFGRFWIGIGRKEGTERQKDECEMFVSKLCEDGCSDSKLIGETINEVRQLGDPSRQQALKIKLMKLESDIRYDLNQLEKSLEGLVISENGTP